MPANVQWPAIEAECDKLLLALRGSATSVANETPTHLAFVLGMYWRSVRLFDATLLLLKSELPEEAAIVARSLFEESLRLQQLAASDADRDSLILGWVNGSITERLGLLSLAKSLGIDNNVGSATKTLNEERRSLQVYQVRHDVKRLRKFGSEREVACRFDRRDDYWAYSLSHELVHGSDVAWLFARKPLAAGEVGFHAKTSDPGIRSAFAEFAAGSVTAAAVATMSMFD